MKLSLVAAVVLIVSGVALFFLPEVNQSLFLYLNSLFPNRIFWTVITTLGDGAFAGCLFYIVFRKRNDLLAKGVIGALVGMATSHGLKRLFGITRPEYTEGFKDSFHFLAESMTVTNYSMPSGHTITAFLLGIFVLFNKKLNQVGKAALLLLMIAVGLSRIALGVHWPADVLVGAGLGIAIAIWCNLLRIEISNKKAIVAVHLLYLIFVGVLIKTYFL